MTAIRDKMKVLKGFLQRGEAVMIAKRYGIENERAWHLSAGQRAPRMSEMDYMNALFDLLIPRYEENKRLQKIN